MTKQWLPHPLYEQCPKNPSIHLPSIYNHHCTDLCFVREKGHCICSANWLSNRLQRFISLDYEKGDLQGNICWYVFNIFITIFVNQIPFCLLGCSKILQTGFFKTKSHTAEFTAIHAYSISICHF